MESCKPVTPIKDILDKEILSKEDLEKRRKSLEKYGDWFMTIQDFIVEVLFTIHGEESTLSAFGRLLNDYGLVIYKDGLHKSDMEKPVFSKELLDKLEHRKTECLIDADDSVFWKPSLNKEKNYYVYIDDVARAYCLAGNNTFDWYNKWHAFNPKCEMTSHAIPEEIKADIKRLSTTDTQADNKTDGKTELKPKRRKKLIPLERNSTESLQLIYAITTAHNVEYDNDLTGSSAWGLIVSEKFTSDLIKTKPISNRDYLVLNDGETLTKAEFTRKYRDRFK